MYIWQLPGWPNWRFDGHALGEALASARLIQGRLLGKAQAIGLDSDAIISVVNDIWVDDAIATAAIEGQRLDLAQVRSSVMRKFDPRSGGPTSRHIDGLVDVMHDALHRFSQPLTRARLCRWQSALFPSGLSGVGKIEVGRYRSFAAPMQIVSGREGKEVVHYLAPPSDRVPAEMTRFLKWFNHREPIDGLLRAAIAHLWFETIHPFEDGNGRVGRAIMDMALAQDAKTELRFASMSRQLLEQRAAYYDALNSAQTGSLDVTDWLHWFVQQFALSCKKSESHIDAALQRARYWSDCARTAFNERQYKVLQKLVDAGDGGFAGGLSAEKYGKITGVSKATATRDLSDLLEKGALVSRGEGRATRYYPNVPGWTHGA